MKRNGPKRAMALMLSFLMSCSGCFVYAANSENSTVQPEANASGISVNPIETNAETETDFLPNTVNYRADSAESLPTTTASMNQQGEHWVCTHVQSWGEESPFKIGIESSACNIPAPADKCVVEFRARVNQYANAEPLGVKIQYADKRLMFRAETANDINYCDVNNTWAGKKPFAVGTDWNVYRVECDRTAGAAKVFINGISVTPEETAIQLQNQTFATDVISIFSKGTNADLDWVQVYEEGMPIWNETWGEEKPHKGGNCTLSQKPADVGVLEVRAKVAKFSGAEPLGIKIVLDGQRMMFRVNNENTINYCSAKGTWTNTKSFAVGNDWHTYRFEYHASAKKAIAFIDGNRFAEIEMQPTDYSKEMALFSNNGAEVWLNYVRAWQKKPENTTPYWLSGNDATVIPAAGEEQSALTISWPAAEAATSYKVSVTDTLGENIVSEQTTTDTNLKLTDLAAGTGYNVKIWGINEHGTSEQFLQGYGDTQYGFNKNSGLSVKNLMVAGKDYAYYRIPALVTTSKGTLLAMAEARSSGSDWAPMDAVLMRSEDGGETWSEKVILAAGKDQGFPCNNPILIPAVDEQGNSVVVLIYCKNYGVGAHRNDGVMVCKSLDDGLTWSDPVNITANCLPDYRNTIATGPGHGIQLQYNKDHKGRLLVSVWMTPKEYGRPETSHGPAVVTTLYSDDMGDTWQMGEIVPLGKVSNPNESTVVELSDGRVMVNMRNTTGNNLRAVSISPDGATGWSEPYFDEALNCPICFASLTRYDDNTILFVNPDTKNGRTHGTVKVSYDDGKTWSLKRLLNDTHSGYADIAVSEVNGTKQISVLLETHMAGSSADTLTLYRFPLSWVMEDMLDQLKSLKLSEGSVALQPNVFDYDVTVDENTTKVTITAEAFDPDAVLTCNDQPFVNNQAEIQLDGISTEVKIAVNKNTYTLKFKKKVPVKPNSCVLYYSMDEIKNGSINDFSGYENTGSVQGDISIVANGKENASAKVNNGHLVVHEPQGLNFGTGDFTASVWLNPENTGKQQFLFWYGTVGTGANAWWARRNNDGSL